MSNINVVDDLSSGTDSNDDGDISRPGISKTFYQPDFQRIKNNNNISANTSAPHDSARMSEVSLTNYVTPHQLQTYHNQAMSSDLD